MYRLPTADQVSAHWENPVARPAVRDAASFELHDGRAILLDQKFGENWGDVEMDFQINRAGKRILLAPDVQVQARRHSVRAMEAV